MGWLGQIAQAVLKTRRFRRRRVYGTPFIRATTNVFNRLRASLLGSLIAQCLLLPSERWRAAAVQPTRKESPN